jgi:hypothetical protein
MIVQTLAGQLVVASLLSRKIKTRLLLRNPEKAVTLFGKQDESVLQAVLHQNPQILSYPEYDFCSYEYLLNDRFMKRTHGTLMLSVQKCLRLFSVSIVL